MGVVFRPTMPCVPQGVPPIAYPYKKMGRARTRPIFNSRSSETWLVATDRFVGARVDARAAIATGLRVNFRVALFHRDGVQRTGLDALATRITLFRIDYGCHYLTPIGVFVPIPELFGAAVFGGRPTWP
jgi:hypothetical protein